MEVFQSWADNIIMLVLTIAYIATFVSQKNTITTLKDRIDAYKKTNEGATALTEIQFSHIETYKRMTDISEIEKYIEMKATNTLVEMMKDNEELMKALIDSADKIINPQLIKQITEQTRFIRHFLNDILKFDKEIQRKIIKKYLPRIQRYDDYCF